MQDGEIVAAALEERFTRKKHDAAFPRNAAAYCVAAAGLYFADLDLVVFYDKPLLKFDRLLETQLAYAPSGFKLSRTDPKSTSEYEPSGFRITLPGLMSR